MEAVKKADEAKMASAITNVRVNPASRAAKVEATSVQQQAEDDAAMKCGEIKKAAIDLVDPVTIAAKAYAEKENKRLKEVERKRAKREKKAEKQTASQLA